MSVQFSVSRGDDSDGHVQLRLAGELDMTCSDELRYAIEQILPTQPSSVVVDLDRLTFLDSSGIQALLAARQAADADHVTMRVVQPHGMVYHVLRVAGVLDYLEHAGPASAGQDAVGY